ncbi:hypothetical protein BDV41DRAFT_575929 [Aspergillus transmontanensis]|uniref:Uncharacterized protein n=1 Tax=Aspergillus transmontanensis TaxID=1034304 RepID=A0A5N6W0S1_9EURO|nr:hypothetical protein BDV41DRAFT_575929 [Aspergillus transmontanensis]
MKFAYILSALASTAVGAPLLEGLLGNVLGKVPVISNLGQLNTVLDGLLGSLGGNGGVPVVAILGGLGKLPTGTTGAIPSGLPSGLPSAIPSPVATPSTPAIASGVPSAGGANGKLLQDLAPQLNNILVVTGPNAKIFLIKLSPEVTKLVSGLGLASLGVPLGGVVASAASVGDLLADLGKPVENVVTVVGADGGALLISLSPEVAALVSNIGLPAVGVPLGTVVAIVGGSL